MCSRDQCERIRKYVGTKSVNRLHEDAECRVHGLRCIRSGAMGTVLLTNDFFIFSANTGSIALRQSVSPGVRSTWVQITV